jgi:hypothetical protein
MEKKAIPDGIGPPKRVRIGTPEVLSLSPDKKSAQIYFRRTTTFLGSMRYRHSFERTP